MGAVGHGRARGDGPSHEEPQRAEHEARGRLPEHRRVPTVHALLDDERVVHRDERRPRGHHQARAGQLHALGGEGHGQARQHGDAQQHPLDDGDAHGPPGEGERGDDAGAGHDEQQSHEHVLRARVEQVDEREAEHDAERHERGLDLPSELPGVLAGAGGRGVGVALAPLPGEAQQAHAQEGVDDAEDGLQGLGHERCEGEQRASGRHGQAREARQALQLDAAAHVEPAHRQKRPAQARIEVHRAEHGHGHGHAKVQQHGRRRQ